MLQDPLASQVHQDSQDPPEPLATSVKMVHLDRWDRLVFLALQEILDSQERKEILEQTDFPVLQDFKVHLDYLDLLDPLEMLAR